MDLDYAVALTLNTVLADALLVGGLVLLDPALWGAWGQLAGIGGALLPLAYALGARLTYELHRARAD